MVISIVSSNFIDTGGGRPSFTFPGASLGTGNMNLSVFKVTTQ